MQVRADDSAGVAADVSCACHLWPVRARPRVPRFGHHCGDARTRGAQRGALRSLLLTSRDDANPRESPAPRRLPDAGGVRAARRLLDAVARAAGQLAPRREARAAGFRRARNRDRGQRAGHRRRLGRAIPECATTVAGGGPRRRTLERRRVDARRRADVRRQRSRRASRHRLGVQRLGRARRAASTFRGIATTRVAQKVLEVEGIAIATAPRSCSKAGRSTSTGRAR